MVWVFVFGGIALAGLVMLIAYAVWLAHKAADVMSEVRVLAERADQLAGLLGQIQVPELSSAGDAKAQRPRQRADGVRRASRRRRMAGDQHGVTDVRERGKHDSTAFSASACPSC